MPNARLPVKNRTRPDRVKERSGSYTQAENERKLRERGRSEVGRGAIGGARGAANKAGKGSAAQSIRAQLGPTGQRAARASTDLEGTQLLLDAVKTMNGALADQAAAGKAVRDALAAAVDAGDIDDVAAAERAHAVAARFVVAAKRGCDFVRVAVKDVWVRGQVDGPKGVEIQTDDFDRALYEAEVERLRNENEMLRAQAIAIPTTH